MGAFEDICLLKRKNAKGRLLWRENIERWFYVEIRRKNIWNLCESNFRRLLRDCNGDKKIFVSKSGRGLLSEDISRKEDPRIKSRWGRMDQAK